MRAGGEAGGGEGQSEVPAAGPEIPEKFPWGEQERS
jgi:hypothetical protein